MDEGITGRLEAIERRLLELEARLSDLPDRVTPPPTPPLAEPVPWRSPVDDRGYPLDDFDVQPPVIAYTPTESVASPTPVNPRPTGATPPPLPRGPLQIAQTARPVIAMDAPVAESQAAREARLASERYAANMRAAYDGGPPPGATSPAPASAPTPPAYSPPPPSPVSTASHGFELEQLLGLKFAGWVGAIILVIGLSLGVKFAYDQGWLGGVPNSVRCAMIALVGMTLIATGEWVFRRINRIAATGLYGAGVAVLFLAAYAGQAWYTLYTSPTAFVLMALSAAVGMGIAARADMVSIAVLAVIGGGIVAPASFAADRHPPGFLAYLLSLQMLSIGLCAWRATPKWWVLRGLALAVTSLWMLDRPGNWSPTPFDLSGFLVAIVMAILYQGELLFTTRRHMAGANWREPARGVTFSLLTTAALVVELLSRMTLESRHSRGEVLLALAVVTALLSRLCGRWSMRSLARGFDVQCILLLAIAIPVMLNGPAVLLGWIALAGGLAVLGVLSRDRLTAIAATCVWLLAAVGVGVWANNSAASAHTWLTIAGEAIRASVVIAAILAVCGHLAAFGLRRTRPSRGGHGSDPSAGLSAGTLLDLAAIGAFSFILIEFVSSILATRISLGYALLLWAAALVPGLAVLGTVSTALLAAVAVKWAAFDVLRDRLSPHWTAAGRPFLNAQMATGVLIAIAFGLQGWSFRRRGTADRENAAAVARGETAWSAMLTVALILLGFGATINVDHAIVLGHSAGKWLTWPGYSAQQLVGTALWAVILVAWVLAVRLTVTTAPLRRDVLRFARVATYVLVGKFIVIDVIGMATNAPYPTPDLVLNLRTGVAVVLIAALTLLGRRTADMPGNAQSGLAVLVILLVTGSAEVDRYAVQQTAGPVWIVRQVGWSIYWALLAVASLLVGFALRHQTLRLVSLGLLGVTLLKVTLIDLSGAGTGWRILSFLALGALLLLTSVLYGRFTQRIAPRQS